MDDLNLVFSLVDIPFVLGIVFVLQSMKKLYKIPSKMWSFVLIGFGFLAAFIKVVPFDFRLFIVQGFIYSAACEFVYQKWRDIKNQMGGKK